METTDFKIKMAEWLSELSVCFNSDSMPYPEEQIVKMVEMIVRLIHANKMTLDLEPYSNSIRMIASGDTEITNAYQLNVVGLMKVFKEEHQRYLNHKRPDKW